MNIWRQKKNYTVSILCLILIFFCLSLRCYRIKADVPHAFDHAFCDEGRKIFNARNMALFGKPTLGNQTPWGVLYTPVFTGLYYTVFRLFTVNTKTARIFSVCICFLTVILFYRIVRKPGGAQPDNAALLATLLFASDFPYFVYSRLALPEVLCIFMVTMSIFMYKKLQKTSPIFHFLFGAFITILPMTKPTLFPYVLGFFVVEVINKKHISFLAGMCFVPSVLCFFLLVLGREQELMLLYKSIRLNSLTIYSKRHILRLLYVLKHTPANFFITIFGWVSGFVTEHPGGAMFVLPFLWLRKNSLKNMDSDNKIYRVAGTLFCVVSACICYILLFISARKWYMLPLMPLLYIMGALVLRTVFGCPEALIKRNNSPLSKTGILYISAATWLFFLSIAPMIHTGAGSSIAFTGYNIEIPFISANFPALMSAMLGKYDWWWHSRYTISAFMLCVVLALILLFFKNGVGKSVNRYGKTWPRIFIVVLLVFHFGVNAARYLRWVCEARNYTYNAAKRIEYIVPNTSIICGASFLALENKNRMFYRDFSMEHFEEAEYFLLVRESNGEIFGKYLKEVMLFPLMGSRIYKLFYLKKRPRGRMKKVLYRFMYHQTI